MTLTDIRPLVRYLIGDNSSSGKDIFTYTNSKIFTLTESNIDSITAVSRNDVTSGVTYTYSSTTKKVTVTSSLASGDTVEINYNFYPNYSDTEIENYIRASIVYLSSNSYYTFVVDSSDKEIYPTPTEKEKNLLAVITSLLINPPVENYRLPDISLSFPSDVSLDEKIRRTIAVFKKDTAGIFFMSNGS